MRRCRAVEAVGLSKLLKFTFQWEGEIKLGFGGSRNDCSRGRIKVKQKISFVYFARAENDPFLQTTQGSEERKLLIFGIGGFWQHTIRKVKFLSKNSILTKPQHFHEFFTPIFSSGAARFERSENRASSSERSEDERSETSHSKTSIRFFSCKTL